MVQFLQLQAQIFFGFINGIHRFYNFASFLSLRS